MWNTLVVNPLAQGLIFLHGLFGSYGLSIIILTVIVRLTTLPLTLKQLRSAKVMQELQPELQTLQKKYGKDKEKLAAEQMKLYREKGANPVMGCLPMLIQMPIWIGLYQALLRMAQTGVLHEGFLWIPSLAEPTNASWLFRSPLAWDLPYVAAYLILPALTVVTQVVLQKMTTTPAASDDPQQAMMNQMTLMMPLMFGFFAVQAPSGLALYWVTSNLFGIFQQYFVSGWGGLVQRERAEGKRMRKEKRLMRGKRKRET